MKPAGDWLALAVSATGIDAWVLIVDADMQLIAKVWGTGRACLITCLKQMGP